MLAVLLSTAAAQISPICLYPAAFLYNISQSCQIFTEQYSRVQIVTQFTSTNNTLINNKYLEPLIRPGLDHARNRSIIRIKLLLQSSISRLHNLGHKNRRIGQLRQDVVNQRPQPRRRLRIWLRRIIAAVQVVRREMDEHDVGLQRYGWLDNANHLADDPAGVALVLIVSHAAGAESADEGHSFSCCDEFLSKFLAVAVRGLALHVAIGDRVA